MFARIAEDVGRLIGTTERRASEWLAQRETLVDRLTRVRNSATWLLTELESTGASAVNAFGSAIRRKRQPARKRKKSAGARHKPVDPATAKQRRASETRRSKQAARVKPSRTVRADAPVRPRKKPERRG